MKFKKGDIVDFVGTQHYRKPNGKVFFTVKPGIARIDGTVEGAEHPYYLVATYGSKSTVKGWVKEDTIKEYHKEIKIDPVSFAESKLVKIALIDENQIKVVNWSNQNWIGAFRLTSINQREKIAKTAEKYYADKLTNISNKDFLNQCLKAVQIEPIEELNKTAFIATGLFFNFLSEDYKTSTDYLRRGDILLGRNIVAIVLTNGKKSNQIGSTAVSKPIIEGAKKTISIAKDIVPKAIETITAKENPTQQDQKLMGNYITIKECELKNGINLGPLVKLPKGFKVFSLGFFENDEDTQWLYVKAEYKNNIYNGFIDKNNLTK